MSQRFTSITVVRPDGSIVAAGASMIDTDEMYWDKRAVHAAQFQTVNTPYGQAAEGDSIVLLVDGAITVYAYHPEFPPVMMHAHLMDNTNYVE